MVFAASSGGQIITMVQSLFTRFDWADALVNNSLSWYGCVGLHHSWSCVCDCGNCRYPKGNRLSNPQGFEAKPLVIRWSILYLVIFYIIFFGAYDRDMILSK